MYDRQRQKKLDLSSRILLLLINRIYHWKINKKKLGKLVKGFIKIMVADLERYNHLKDHLITIWKNLIENKYV